jgi:multidrug efflux pump subunit AcrA (membrane-fusion protein)
VLAIPDAAVVEVEGRRRVYVKQGPEEFVARDVVLGARDGEYHAVREGLKEGERVVTRGTYQLRSAAGGR